MSEPTDICGVVHGMLRGVCWSQSALEQGGWRAIVVPEIRDTVERRSANDRVALVASMSKRDTSRFAVVSSHHNRAVVASQFVLSNRLREAGGALDEGRLVHFAMLGLVGPVSPARREYARLLRRRLVHRAYRDYWLPREFSTATEEP